MGRGRGDERPGDFVIGFGDSVGGMEIAGGGRFCGGWTVFLSSGEAWTRGRWYSLAKDCGVY